MVLKQKYSDPFDDAGERASARRSVGTNSALVSRFQVIFAQVRQHE